MRMVTNVSIRIFMTICGRRGIDPMKWFILIAFDLLFVRFVTSDAVKSIDPDAPGLWIVLIATIFTIGMNVLIVLKELGVPDPWE